SNTAGIVAGQGASFAPEIFMHTLPSRLRPTSGKIRNASLLDTTELARLLITTPADVAGLLSHRHLPLPDRRHGPLGAAVHFDVAHGHATMDMLVVDSELAGCDVEDRMTGVARALCEAYGCDCVETRAAAR